MIESKIIFEQFKAVSPWVCKQYYLFACVRVVRVFDSSLSDNVIMWSLLSATPECCVGKYTGYSCLIDAIYGGEVDMEDAVLCSQFHGLQF